jgi:hypothetical protein
MLGHVASHHLLTLMTKIVASYLHVTICIQWNQRMKLYSLIFSFIQYPLSFATTVACNLFKTTKKILVTNVICG